VFVRGERENGEKESEKVSAEREGYIARESESARERGE